MLLIFIRKIKQYNKNLNPYAKSIFFTKDDISIKRTTMRHQNGSCAFLLVHAVQQILHWLNKCVITYNKMQFHLKCHIRFNLWFLQFNIPTILQLFTAQGIV